MHVTQVKNVIIWGNHSSTQFPDVNHGTVDGKPIREVLKDSSEWLDNEFVDVVQQRGAAVIKVRSVAIQQSSGCILSAMKLLARQAFACEQCLLRGNKHSSMHRCTLHKQPVCNVA